MHRLGDDGRDWLRANFQATSTNMLFCFFLSLPLYKMLLLLQIKATLDPNQVRFNDFPPE